MKYKTCTLCKKTKAINCFNWKVKGEHKRTRCKNCTRSESKNHYNNNKNYYLKRNKKNLIKLKSKVRKIKSQPCMDCGKSYPYYVMDFDHRNPVEKDKNVGNMMYSGGDTRVMNEIKKCDLVCANCHRYRTWEKKNE